MKIAIVIFTLIVAIVSWIIRDKIPNYIFYGMLIILILIAGLQIAVIVKDNWLKQTEVFSGVLKPGKNIILSTKDHIYPELEFGDSGAVFAYAGPQGKPVFMIAEENMLTIYTDPNGSIKVSTLIRDRRGEVVAELINNEWKVNKNRSWDRNYSTNALELDFYNPSRFNPVTH